jgi:hypothetical protein
MHVALRHAMHGAHQALQTTGNHGRPCLQIKCDKAKVVCLDATLLKGAEPAAPTEVAAEGPATADGASAAQNP